MKTGTNYAQNDTTIEDLAQSWAVLQESTEEYNLQSKMREAGEFELAVYNVAYMAFSHWSSGPYKDVEPREPVLDQCSIIDTESTSEYHKFTPKSWAFIFELQLHDAMVTHTFMAAREKDTDKALRHARIALDCASYRRQIQLRLQSYS